MPAVGFEPTTLGSSTLREAIEHGGDEAMAPLVTIGLPVFNSERYLRNSLDSLLGQTYTDFVLIISDNASEDATPVICDEYVR